MFTGVGACELVSVGLSGGIEVHAFFFFSVSAHVDNTDLFSLRATKRQKEQTIGC